MKIFNGLVQYYNQHGEGVVFIGNKPVYVYGAIKGEKIEYEIVQTFKNYHIGKLINILSPSENRKYHNIKNAHLIGGYDLIHMNDFEQKQFRIEKVINDFWKIAKIKLENIEWLEGKKKIKYRNKITLHDGYFYQKKTNEIIEIEDFLLSDIKWDKNKKGTIIYRQLDTLISGSKDDIKYTTDKLLNYNFRIGLNSFYQVNKEVTEIAYQYIKDNIIKNATVLDLYCGIGTIGIILSDISKNVVGIEINKNSYEDALYNKYLNNINNISFVNANVDNFVKENKIKFDNVILDPPRKGVDKKTLNIIKNEIKPKRIIYMSCNPATQASNINYLCDKYHISKFSIIDMFPQTYHIETIAILDIENI